MKTIKKRHRKYASFLLLLIVLTACGSKKSETNTNSWDAAIADVEDEEIPEHSGDDQQIERPNGEQSTAPIEETEEDGSEQKTEGSDEEQLAQAEEEQEQGANHVIRNLTPEEWEQVEQNEMLIMLHSESGGNYYIDPAESTIYYREIYAHETEEGSYFRPSYSSESDETMLAPSGTDEDGKRLYDVYYGKKLLISGLAMVEGTDEYLLDVCYDMEAQEVLILTYCKDLENKEEGFMVYHASENDTCAQPLRFYPILTGEDYQELVYPDWIWSAILTAEAIYYDILPVQRIDLKNGDVMDWGLTGEEYTDVTGIENPMRFRDTKAAGSGYIMTIVANPDPAFDDMPENTVDTYIIYTADGELAHVISNVY